MKFPSHPPPPPPPFRKHLRRRMESLCLRAVFWHRNDTCFTIAPFPFSLEGVDLSTPAGEKWASRTLPPRPRGCINERVAKEKVGGDRIAVAGEGAAGVCVGMIVEYRLIKNSVKFRNLAGQRHLSGPNWFSWWGAWTSFANFKENTIRTYNSMKVPPNFLV